jgi:hypothetical protein
MSDGGSGKAAARLSLKWTKGQEGPVGIGRREGKGCPAQSPTVKLILAVSGRLRFPGYPPPL